MYKKILLLVLVVLFFASYGFAEEKKLFFYDFNIGMKLLEIEQKTSLVVVDSEHCVYCKKLKNVTFKDKDVVDILNKYYITIELNLDKNESIHYKKYDLSAQSFAAGFKIKGTPTLIFFDEKADPITLLPGYLPPDKILPVLKYVGQRIFEKNVKFGEYIKKPVEGKYRGTEKVIPLSLEDLKFVSKNDPFVRVYAFSDFDGEKEIPNLKKIKFSIFSQKIENFSRDNRYILIDNNMEKVKALGEKMLSSGFPGVFIYDTSKNVNKTK